MHLNLCVGVLDSSCRHKYLLAIYDAVHSTSRKRTVGLRISRLPIPEAIGVHVADRLSNSRLSGDGRPVLNVSGLGCVCLNVVL